MMTRNLLLVLWLLALAGGRGLAADPALPNFREVRVHVVDSQGHAAPFRKVDLIRLTPASAGSSPPQTWHFVTNETGDLQVHIGDFAGVGAQPGWGLYDLVAEPSANDAGGISSRFWLGDPAGGSAPGASAPDGDTLPLPAAGLALTIAIENGFALRGRVLDEQNLSVPLAGVEVWATNLYDPGFGAPCRPLFTMKAVTDDTGNFVFPHVLPQKLHLEIRSAIWLRTRQTGIWQDEVADMIDAPADGLNAYLEIGAAPAPRFHYFGRVTDAEGNPVAGAVVGIETSLHPEPADGENGNEIEHATTDDDGTYNVLVPTPWAQSIAADAPGRGKTSLDKISDDQVLPPGQYDLTFCQ